jgi:hypothetical protein
MDGEILFGMPRDTFFHFSILIWVIAAIIKSVYQYIEDVKIYDHHVEQITKELEKYIDVDKIELEFRESEILL